MTEIFIVGGARTAIGSFAGGLASLRPAELGAIVIREAIARAGLTPEQIGNVVIGTVVPTQPKDAYVSRVAAVDAGIPVGVPAMNVNRLCGSGLQAIVSAAQGIALAEQSIAVAGGTESMSNAPLMVLTARYGQRMGDQVMLDAMLGALQDPFEDIHMGITAENVAIRYDISREAQDALAVESHRRATAAIANGYFKNQIVPVEIKTRKGATVFDTDEHVRADASPESMAKLRPVFKKDGSVTAGNSSGINDGAAAVVLASGEAVVEHGLKPLARIVAWGHAGVEPSVMGLGPVKAVPIALEGASQNLVVNVR